MQTLKIAQTYTATRIARNTLLLTLGKAMTLPLNLATTAILGRYLGVTGYGTYGLVFAYIAILAVFADFGANNILVRERAKGEDHQGSLVMATFMVRSMGALLTFSCAVGLVPLLSQNPEVTHYVRSAAVLLLIGAFSSLGAIFDVKLKAEYPAAVNLTTNVLLLLSILAAEKMHWGITHIIFLNILFGVPGYSGLIAGLFSIVIIGWLARKFQRVRLAIDLRRSWMILLEAAPLGLSAIFAIVAIRADSIILSAFRGQYEVGLFGAGTRVIEMCLLPITFLGASLLPSLSNAYGECFDTFCLNLQRCVDFCFMVATLLFLFLYIFPEQLVAAIFGRNYDATAMGLRTLSAGGGLWAMCGLTGIILVSCNRQKINLLCAFIGMTVSLSCNYLLVPAHGFLGSCVAQVLQYGAVCAVGFIALHRVTQGRLKFHAGAVSVPVALLVSFLSIGPGSSVMRRALVFLAISAVYCSIAMKVGSLKWNDVWRLLTSFMPSRPQGGGTSRSALRHPDETRVPALNSRRLDHWRA